MVAPVAAHAAMATLEAPPRVDRYFPQCWCSIVEAVSRHRFGIGDFGKIYGRHTFSYRRPEGPVRYRDNGVELDLELHRERIPDHELAGLIEDIYGVRTSAFSFDDFGDYCEYTARSIADGIPVVSDFDLGFIRARREYGKVYGTHIIALYGYDPDAGTVLAAEQMLGTIAVGADDFSACFARKVREEAGMRVWDLTRVSPEERPLGRAEALERIEANVRNLTAQTDDLGLCALSRFREDLAEYLGSDSFRGNPFSIPGLWVFSHERHVERKWLKALQSACGERHRELFEEFDALLSSSFKRWLHTDYLIEKCLASGNGGALKSLPKALDDILGEERRALRLWQTLGDAVASSQAP